MPDERAIASDGLLARVSGGWAEGKLSFLDEFGPPALTATGTKRQRYYLDLFAGPGKNIERGTSREFDGSALRALRMQSTNDARLTFTHAVFVNKSTEDHAALGARMERAYAEGGVRIPRAHVENLPGDANQLLPGILRRIHPQGYLLAFADIEAPEQWPWSTVRLLRVRGPKSTDLCLLFPLGMALNRMISFSRDATEANANALTAFFGSEEWRTLADRRITDAQSPELRRGLEELYLEGLRSLGWTHAKVVRDVRRTGQHQLYKLIFASNHDAGGRIAAWSAGKEEQRSQLGFDFSE